MPWPRPRALGARPDGGHPGPPPPRGAHRQGAEHGGPDPAHHRRRLAGAIATSWPDTGVDLLVGIGGTPEGVIAAAALKSMGGEIQDGSTPATRRSGGRPSTSATTRRRPHHGRPGQGDNCFFAATGITDGEAAPGRPLRRVRGQHPVPRDAVQVGHGPAHRRPSPAPQAVRVQRHRVRLSDGGPGLPAGGGRIQPWGRGPGGRPVARPALLVPVMFMAACGSSDNATAPEGAAALTSVHRSVARTEAAGTAHLVESTETRSTPGGTPPDGQRGTRSPPTVTFRFAGPTCR